jgi:PhnB protein
MKLNVHLNFNGNAAEAFAFYEKALGKKIQFKMTWGEAPKGAPMPPGWDDKIMHISMPLGTGILMGCDAPPGSSTPIGGIQVSVETDDQAEVTRVYEALKEGGSVQMPLAPTFWSPLFGMCTDKFGVAWMVGVPGPDPTKG